MSLLPLFPPPPPLSLTLSLFPIDSKRSHEDHNTSSESQRSICALRVKIAYVENRLTSGYQKAYFYHWLTRDAAATI